MCLIIEPTLAHCEELARMLRPDDAAEVVAAGFEPTGEIIWSIVATSTKSHTFMIRGVVAAVGGVVDRGGGEGEVWLLTSTICDATKLTFWKTSKLAIVDFGNGFDALFVHIDARYSRAIAWAMRLGFEVDEPKPIFNGAMFCLARRKS